MGDMGLSHTLPSFCVCLHLSPLVRLTPACPRVCTHPPALRTCLRCVPAHARTRTLCSCLPARTCPPALATLSGACTFVRLLALIRMLLSSFVPAHDRSYKEGMVVVVVVVMPTVQGGGGDVSGMRRKRRRWRWWWWGNDGCGGVASFSSVMVVGDGEVGTYLSPPACSSSSSSSVLVPVLVPSRPRPHLCRRRRPAMWYAGWL